MEPKERIVTDPAEFRDLVAGMRTSGTVGFDTEFVGERTYFPRLCLIQLGTKTAAAAVDPLAVGDLSPLDDLLYDASVLKVVHAGWQDLKIMHQRTGRVPSPVFDTQIAAALLGMPAQAAYAAVVREILGIEVKKGHSYSDWSARPLSPSQLAYALDDVRYLPSLHDRMVERLDREGRLSWIEPEIAALSSPASYGTDPDRDLRRVKGWASLDRRRMAVLRALIAWREGEAMRRDIPRRRVLADESALAIARSRPADEEALRRVRGLEWRVGGGIVDGRPCRRAGRPRPAGQPAPRGSPVSPPRQRGPRLRRGSSGRPRAVPVAHASGRTGGADEYRRTGAARGRGEGRARGVDGMAARPPGEGTARPARRAALLRHPQGRSRRRGEKRHGEGLNGSPAPLVPGRISR